MASRRGIGEGPWRFTGFGDPSSKRRCSKEEEGKLTGTIWLRDLPTALASLGNVTLFKGWENRARSSGGYTKLMGIVVHHTASSTSTYNDTNYMWNNSPTRPVGAIYLARNGEVVIGAAGATNCAGRGGPFTTSKGTIALDTANSNTISIEAGNAGTGEPWPAVQQTAYVALVACLCKHYGLDPMRDVLAHFEWAPTRKIDPAGSSRYAAGGNKWNMDRFRNDVKTKTIPDEEDDEVTQEQIDEIVNRVLAGVAGKVWTFKVGNIVTAEMDEAADVMRQGQNYAYKAMKQTEETT